MTPVHEIALPVERNPKGACLYIKREDLNHPHIKGNKWRKLKYNLQAARERGCSQLLTFGGAFSNHIYAVAAAGEEFGFETIGVIRGERVRPLNPVLAAAEHFGMTFRFVSRAAYRQKKDPGFLERLMLEYPDAYIIPEGGTNDLAIKGCGELMREINQQGRFDIVCAPAGTGGTVAGLIAGAMEGQEVIGFASLKGNFLQKEVAGLLSDYNGKVYYNWHINNDYHFGGYAKSKPELLASMAAFKKGHGIPLERVYTGKMVYGVLDMIGGGRFPTGARVLMLHTGGLLF